MKRNYKKLLAIIVGLALVIQYSIGAGVFTSYAEELQDDTASNKTEASVPEAKEKDPEPAPKAQEPESKPSEASPAPKEKEPEPAQEQKEPEPKPIEAQPAEQTAELAVDTNEGQDESGDADATEEEIGDTGSESATESDVLTEDVIISEEELAEEAVPSGPSEEELADDADNDVDDEDEDKDDEYPEVTLSKTVAGVTITLHAPKGALPEGAKLRAGSVGDPAIFAAVEERLEAKGKEMTDAIAFDVTPLDKNGKEIQPRKSVSVTFSGTGLDAGDGGIDVFRVSDNAASVTEMGATVATESKQQFSTDHFTIYVSTGSVTDPNGDGEGDNTDEHRLVLEYDQEVTLESDKHAKYDNFNLADGSGITVSSTTEQGEVVGKVHNVNNGNNDVEATVVHSYGKNKNNVTREYYYILAKTKKVPVTFNIMQPGESTYTQVSEQEVYRGTKATEPDHEASIEKDGKTYKFYGWYSNEACTESADPNKTITGDGSDFYARYTPEVTLTYNRNTNDVVTMPDPSSVTTGAGMSVTIGSASRSEYGFLGWAESPTATEADPKYDPGKVIAMPEEGLTLYAVWTESTETIYIYYDCSPSSTTIPRTEASARSQANLSDTIPERNQEQVFVGWSETKHATSPTYYPGQTVETEDENIYLYAVWGHLSDWERTISVNGREETYDGNTYEVTIVGEEAPNADGYIDLGVYHNTRYYIKASDIYASGTNVGTYSTPIMAQLYDYKHGNYRPVNFYIEVKNTKLIIVPAEVRIVTDSASKPYDGTPLTAGGKVFFPADSETGQEFPHEGGLATLVNNETISVKTTASRVDIGKEDNTFEIDWGSSSAKKHNYAIDSDLGELEVIGTVEINYEVSPENSGTVDPAKEEVVETDDAKGSTATAGPGYAFDKWTKGEDTVGLEEHYTPQKVEGKNVAATYTANFKEKDIIITYETDGNGTVSKPEETVGAVDVEASEVEGSTAMASEGYEFEGWYVGETKISGASEGLTPEQVVDNLTEGTETTSGYKYYTDTKFTAKFKQKTFTVTWVNEDGTELEKDENVPYGTTPSFDGETPTKASDSKNTYEFAGWDPEIVGVTENATYTATYTATPIPAPTPDDPDEPDEPDEPDNPTPADDDDDDDTTPAAAAAAAAAPPAGPAAPAEDIEDEPTPQTEPPVSNIEDEPTPLANTWSVVNLALAALTALGAVIALFRKREDEDEYDDEDADKKMLAAKIVGAAAGVAAPLTFFLTENMQNVPTAIDKWTPLMAGLLAVQVVSAIVNKAASNGSEFEEDAE